MAYTDVTVQEKTISKPKFDDDDFSHITRGDLYPSVPFSMVIVGPSGSGKTTLIKKILDPSCGDEALHLDYDLKDCYGCGSGFNRYPNVMTYTQNTNKDDRKKECIISVYDDPPIHDINFRKMINDTFKRGRHDGKCPILCLHNLSELGGDRLKDVRANLNILVLTRRGMQGVATNHPRLLSNVVQNNDLALTAMGMDADYVWIVPESNSVTAINFA